MTMKKIVNIQSQYPLYVFTPPLNGVINKAELSYPEIYNCLSQGAIIYEVLSDGTEILITYKNYNTVNDIIKSITKIEVPEQKIEPVDELVNAELVDELINTDIVEVDELVNVEPVDELVEYITDIEVPEQKIEPVDELVKPRSNRPIHNTQSKNKNNKKI